MYVVNSGPTTQIQLNCTTTEMNPTLLIGLFEMALKKKDDTLTIDPQMLLRVIGGRDLNKAQINHIVGLCGLILANSRLKREYDDFCLSNLNMKNVFVYLKNAKRAGDVLTIAKCLSYIDESVGIQIKMDGSCGIYSPIVPWNKLIGYITSLSDIWGDQFAITLPLGDSLNEAAMGFIETHGKFIIRLILHTNRADDNCVDRILQACPNLQTLSLKSDYLYGWGLTYLETLKDLKSLTIHGSYLSNIPCKWPACLELLDLSHCPKLSELPKIWPAALKDFNLDHLPQRTRKEALSCLLDQNFELGMKALARFQSEDIGQIT